MMIRLRTEKSAKGVWSADIVGSTQELNGAFDQIIGMFGEEYDPWVTAPTVNKRHAGRDLVPSSYKSHRDWWDNAPDKSWLVYSSWTADQIEYTTIETHNPDMIVWIKLKYL